MARPIRPPPWAPRLADWAISALASSTCPLIEGLDVADRAGDQVGQPGLGLRGHRALLDSWAARYVRASAPIMPQVGPRPARPRVSSASPADGRRLVDVGDAVAVLVAVLALGEGAVVAAAAAEQEAREQGGHDRSEEDGGLGKVQLTGLILEGELGDEQRDREPDAREQADGRDVAPGQVLGQLSPGQAGDQPGAAEDADELADDQAEHDPPGRPGRGRAR